MPPSPAPSARPVVVLTGALGAGKTTLLNAALNDRLLGAVAVVVNEFGAVGIDHELVQPSTEDVVLLPGGCLCCAVRSDLAEALTHLDRAAARSEVPAFERVVIETSGLAEPGPILQLFAEAPRLTGRFRLDAIVTLVDALLGEGALAFDGTALRQVVLADRLLLSKWESAPLAALARLEAALEAVSPFAQRLRAPRGAARAEWFHAPPARPPRELPPGVMHAAHDESIEAFAIGWQEPQPLASMGAWLEDLAARFGARLMRVKGIARARDVGRPVAIHAVQHLVAPPEFLPATAGGGAADSRVVFIVRGLEPGDVRPPWPTTLSDR